MNNSNKNNSEILSSVFQEILNEKKLNKNTKSSSPINDVPVSLEHIDLELIQDEYTGKFEDELNGILNGEPLTFSNLHKALKENRATYAQIQRIIEKIDSYTDKIKYISELFESYKDSEKYLDEYSKSKLIHPKITRDKFYFELKTSIKQTKEFLNKKYKIKNQKDLNKKIEHSKNRKSLIGKLNAMKKSKIHERTLLVLSIKKLVKKVKGNIISLHPELSQFIEFLSFEQLSNLKILKEQFNFTPHSKEDFTKEIKLCKIAMKNNPEYKEYYKLKIKLLDSVSSELYKNLTHSKNLERGYKRERTTDRIIDYGNPT